MSSLIRRVAVTGAAGYIAQRLIRRLERDDEIERILALDIRRPASDHNSEKVVFCQHDVTRPMTSLFQEHGVEATVDLAFILNPGHDREAIRRINVGGAASVLDSCLRAGVRHILYLSSTSVYGSRPDNRPMLTEDAPVRPVTGFQYSEDKAVVELLLKDFTRRHPTLSATILRVSPVIGPNADNFISHAFVKPFLVGVRGCDPYLQFIHEDDLTDIMLFCLTKSISGVYNLAGDGAIKWSAMADIFGRKLINFPSPVLSALTGLTWNLRLQGDSPPSGLNFVKYGLTVSTEKIRRELGVKTRYSSKEAWESFAQAGRG